MKTSTIDNNSLKISKLILKENIGQVLMKMLDLLQFF